MVVEAGIDFHHGAPRCLLGLFDAAAGGLADDLSRRGGRALGIEVRGLSRVVLRALI